MFFKAMPRLSYKAGDKTILSKDIFRRVGLDRRINSKLALQAYYVKDGETPEMLANNFYSTSKYHWILLTVNDIVNVNEEWPKSQALLYDYAQLKYGTENILNDHHYRLTANTSITVDYDATAINDGTIQAVSNLDYEIDENEKKRQIYILKPEFLAQFVTNYKSLMAQ